MTSVIELKNVTKQFGSQKAVDSISLTVEKGRIIALLGPNGAGKTTAVSMMLGLLKPTAGTVMLMGQDPRNPKARNRIGAMLQEVCAIDRLTVKETLELFRSYYDQPMKLERLLQISGLEKEARQQADQLSGGQKRRLDFALALAGDPDVLFLDEPTVGMDVTSRKLFWDTLRVYANNRKTILLTTHYLEEADSIADEIVVINKGRKVAQGTPAQLKSAAGGSFVSFRAGDRVTPESVSQLPGVLRTEWSGRHVRIQTENTDQLLACLFQQNIEMHGIEIQHSGLTDVFESIIQAEKGFSA